MNEYADDMSSEERLSEEVASLVRVRNRLSKSPDHQLPKILPVLLPRLMHRLEQSLAIESYESSRCKDLSVLAQEHMTGILHHALERIRGNSDLPTGNVLKGMLPFLRSKSTVIGTWALIFVQGGTSRCTIETLPLDTAPTLIQTIDQLQSKVTVGSCKTSLARLTSSSWILLDCIIMGAGLKPLIDWDLDYLDEKDLRWEMQQSDNWDALASDKAIAAASENGAGFFHLLLDLLLFWPTELAAHSGISVDGEARLCHRSRIPDEEQQIQRRPRPGRRIVIENKWGDMAQNYLRQLKLISLRYAIWPAGSGLFQGVNSDRALVLALLFASPNSMHGRLAADYVNHVSLTKKIQKEKTRMPLKYSSNVAFALLILMVGDQRAMPVLQTFQKQHGRAPWTSILGAVPAEESRQRPPLPSTVSSRVSSFLLRHLLSVSKMDESRAEMRLLVDLAVLLATRPEGDGSLRSSDERKYGKFWAVELIQLFLNHLIPASTFTERSSDEWTSSVVRSCLDVAVEVASIVVEIGESNVEYSQLTGRQPLLGGVEAPFQRRRDLNRMLNTHRASLKRRKLGADDAIRARQVAYEVISRTATHSIERESRPFELPMYLLRCAIYEENHMQSFVATASTSLLKIYSDHVRAHEWHHLCATTESDGSQNSLQHLVVPLLPAVLDAVCSDSPNARLMAIDWIKHFLRVMDIEAAWYLINFLILDHDKQVSSAAEKAMSTIGVLPKQARVECSKFDFVDRSTGEGLQKLKTMMQTRVQEVSDTLGIPFELAQPLLVDFKFLHEKLATQFATATNAQTTMEKSCLLQPNLCHPSGQDSNESICGICYEDLQLSENFSLECGHVFCQECWVAYLEIAGRGRKLGILDMRCPREDCACRVLRRHLQRLSAEVQTLWDEQFFGAFLEFDSTCCACPGLDCHFVAATDGGGGHGGTDTCTCFHCNKCFCFGCAEEPHQPATCSAKAEWARIQSKSDFWVRKNSKPCPGCHAPIQKTQGCNHMTCTCGVQFCWLCLTQLRRHSENHTCNRYDPADDADNDYERRALFVAERYEAHLQAQFFAESQLKTLEERPEKLVEIFWFLTKSDEMTLIDGVLTLCDARKFLRNSYVASFGLRENPTRLKMLENYQSALEMLTERLSQLTETNLQRLFLEKGESGVKGHLHGLGFYRLSVSNYMDRFNAAMSMPSS